MAEETPEQPTGSEYGTGWEESLTQAGGEKPPDWAVKFFNAIYQAIVRAADAVWTHLFRQLIARFADLWTWTTSTLEAGENGAWRAAFDALQRAGLIDPKIAERILRIENVPAPLGSILNIMLILGLIKEYTGALGSGIFAPLTQGLNKEFSPNLPGVSDLIRASFIAPELTGELREKMSRQGFSDADIDKMYIAAYALYTPDVVRDLSLRGVFDDAKVSERLHEMGFTDTRIAEIKQTWPLIPGVQDLIMMAVKEAFSPEIAEKFGQYEDFPGDVVPYASALGLSEDWVKRYWAAHWNLPGAEQGFQMMHRGIINEDDLGLLLRALDVMPFWRDKLMAMSYTVLSRIDTRRMHEVDVLSDDEVKTRYMSQGYNDEDAEKMMELSIKLKNAATLKISEAKILAAYKEYMITKDDVRTLLQRLKYRDESIDWLLAHADYDVQLDYQADYIAAAKTRFVNILWDELQTRTALAALNLPGARIEALIARWTPLRISDHKLPSKTDLDKFYRNAVINADEYKIEMYKLGYNFKYTDWYKTIVDMKKAG